MSWEIDLEELLNLLYYCIDWLYGNFVIKYGSYIVDAGQLFFALIIVKGLLDLFFTKGINEGWRDDDIFD